MAPTAEPSCSSKNLGWKGDYRGVCGRLMLEDSPEADHLLSLAVFLEREEHRVVARQSQKSIPQMYRGIDVKIPFTLALT